MNSPTSQMVTRFAPSPSGRLHSGHALAALIPFREALKTDGRFLLRIEDIDRERCRPEFEDGIFEDLAWLGLTWEMPVRRQSDHMQDYAAAISTLEGQEVIYPCFCSRADIRAEIARSDSAPHGPDGALYPGTCRDLSADERAARIAAGDAHALRLDVAKALENLSGSLIWQDRLAGEVVANPAAHGDVVLARKDTPTSYHLSVVVDDALQGITLVTRGQDLFEATDIHCLLQALLDLPTPDYFHHDLVRGEDGRRLATRHKARTLENIRISGMKPAELFVQLGLD
jgi:glutamyl-Q tRNA(Asp) synthetase